MKILKILFILLILITLSEISYYIYFSLRFKQKATVTDGNSDTKKQSQFQCSTATPIPLPNAVDPNICNYLKGYNVTQNQKLRLLLEQTGFVSEITNNYKTKSGKILDLRFSINDDNGKKMQTYGFSKEDLRDSLKIYKLTSNGEKVSASVEDLKQNNLIKLTTIEDLRTVSGEIVSPSNIEILIQK